MQFQKLCLVLLSLMLLGGGQAGADVVLPRNGPTSAHIFYFENRGYIPKADSVLTATRSQLQVWLQNDLDFSADIYLVESETLFDSLIGGSFPDWGAAAAIPLWNRIVIKSPDHFQLNRSLSELVSHEYSHLALAHRTGLQSAPRWLDEGLAMMVSTEWSWSHNLAMNLAAVTGDLVPLKDINQVNQFGQAQAQVAYAESYLAVKYLFDTYGVEGVTLLLDEIARGQSIDKALLAATGSNSSDFEGEINVYLLGKFNLIGLLADTMYFWLALAVVVVIGFFLSLKRRRKYYERWEEEDRLASKDFDYGDADHPEQTDDDEPWRQ